MEVIGESIKTPQDAEKLILENDSENSILFIDEVHQMKPFETFYPVMQDGKLFTINGETVPTNIKIFGATTKPNKLDRPFNQRFNCRFYLRPYSNKNLEDIVIKLCENNPTINGLEIGAVRLIARASQGIVRIARNDLIPAALRIALYEKNQEDGRIIIRAKHVKHVFNIRGIDEVTGLNSIQLDVLRILNNNKTPVGSKNISEIIGIDVNYYSEIIEPFLVRNSYINRSSRGRTITDKGKAVL